MNRNKIIKNIKNNKFHKGAKDGKHYWLTPPDVYKQLNDEFHFNWDPCSYPKPKNFDGLTSEWGKSNYVNPPFGSILHNGKKKGATAWARKAIEENKKGKQVVVMINTNAFINMLIEAGAEMRSMGRVKWLDAETGEPWGSPSCTTCFILRGKDRQNNKRRTP